MDVEVGLTHTIRQVSHFGNRAHRVANGVHQQHERGKALLAVDDVEVCIRPARSVDETRFLLCLLLDHERAEIVVFSRFQKFQVADKVLKLLLAPGIATLVVRYQEEAIPKTLLTGKTLSIGCYILRERRDEYRIVSATGLTGKGDQNLYKLFELGFGHLMLSVGEE